MSSMNQSVQEAVSIDDEIFFGPITEKEKKVKEQFENYINSTDTNVRSLPVAEKETSINDSLYKSFQVEDSKYDSFEDSLNEDIEEKPQATKHITLRKSFDKLKAKKHAFYDSLEDVCSLVSNMDKCSISCGVENSSNVVEKQYTIEDSLKAPLVFATTKNDSAEQMHFDDDSLAVAEFENTFDDSLEDINMISSIESIEIEGINDLDNVIVNTNVDQKPLLLSRNLFDTIDVIYEKSDFVKGVSGESFDGKNKLFDSLSSSECKDVFKDSLDGSENGIAKLNSLKNDSDLPVTSESPGQNVSVQILYENLKNSPFIENALDSKCCDLSKENFENVNSRVVDQSTNKTPDIGALEISEFVVAEKEKLSSDENVLDASVQFLCEKHNNNTSSESISEYFDALKDEINNLKSTSSCSVEQPVLESSLVDKSKQSSSFDNVDFVSQNVEKHTSHFLHDSGNLSKNGVQCKSDENNEFKILKDNSVTVDNSTNKKETIIIDACQLKILNENLLLDKDVKFQLQIEVTVGDRKCKIEPENIKIIPALGPKECEKISLLSNSVQSFERKDAAAPAVSEGFDEIKMSNVENRKKRISLGDGPNENILNEANIPKDTHQMKESSPNLHEEPVPFVDSVQKSLKDSKTECGKSDISLLHALDLHDISLFLNDSVIQSNDSLMALNLSFENKPQSSLLTDESNGHFPELKFPSYNSAEKYQSPSHNKASPYSMKENKIPSSLKDGVCSRENSAKRTGGTRIPVRKGDKFVTPVSTAYKTKTPISAEKEKKCVHSPHSADSWKRTPSTTVHKHHFCKVRNTIFSKVPQIVPSKKFMNVQSPVAQYIRNAQSSAPVKTPVFEPILRDCMNDIRFHQQLESPYQPHTLPKGRSYKVINKKA